MFVKRYTLGVSSASLLLKDDGECFWQEDISTILNVEAGIFVAR